MHMNIHIYIYVLKYLGVSLMCCVYETPLMCACIRFTWTGSAPDVYLQKAYLEKKRH